MQDCACAGVVTRSSGGFKKGIANKDLIEFFNRTNVGVDSRDTTSTTSMTSEMNTMGFVERVERFCYDLVVTLSTCLISVMTEKTTEKWAAVTFFVDAVLREFDHFVEVFGGFDNEFFVVFGTFCAVCDDERANVGFTIGVIWGKWGNVN